MKTEKEINNDILRITVAIKEKHPELTKYLDEMPDNLDTDGDGIANQRLLDYHDSLVALLAKYSIDHPQ